MHEIVIPQKSASGLKLYAHEKGLISIAAAETAQKHFARAKNLDGLTKAIEEKLKAQRDFVLWWDSIGEKSGSGPSKRCPGSETPLPIAGRNGLPDRRVIHRWRAPEDYGEEHGFRVRGAVTWTDCNREAPGATGSGVFDSLPNPLTGDRLYKVRLQVVTP